MEKTLVVMAAGVGSRFGGLKQIVPVDSEEQFIIDYSIFDAIKKGFTKVVFIIKEEYLKLFKDSIEMRIADKIKVEYAFQRVEDVPLTNFKIMREKPWGTVQALLCAKNYVKEPFIVINADDFYGEKAFQKASEFLDNNRTPYYYACLSYQFGVTQSSYGSVKRGVLELSGEFVHSIIESKIDWDKDKLIATPLNGETPFDIQKETPVSMNLFAFQPDVFSILEDYWLSFFKQDQETLLTREALLPECLMENIKKDKIKILNLPSESIWLGMTYQSDLEIVKTKLQNLKKQNKYPKHLWR